MKIAIIYIFLFGFALNLQADYQTGKKIFEKKCASCHIGYISKKVLEDNFYKKDNKLLKLKAPTVNMLAYFMVNAPTHIGDKNDPDMQKIEIEEFLKDYLYKPNRKNSVIRAQFLKYFSDKKSMEGVVSDEEISDIADYLFDYKKAREKSIKKAQLANLSIDDLIKKAKLQNKFILVEAMSTTCYYCEKMKKDVLSKQKVQGMIDKNYIFIKIDVDKTKLPLKLDTKYKKITPTFFILSPKGEFLYDFPGAWSKEDFMEILKEALKKK